jgi:glutaredoxin 3
MAQQVKIYSTPTCPWCKRTKQFFDDNKVFYQNLDVASDRGARDEMITKSGQMGVPVIDIDGEIAVGFDEKWLRQKLNV